MGRPSSALSPRVEGRGVFAPLRLLLHTPSHVSRWTPFFLAFAVAACSPCPYTKNNLALPDGGPVRCVTAEDCPRTANDLVCVQNGPFDFTSSCVGCSSTVCQRTVVTCQ